MDAHEMKQHREKVAEYHTTLLKQVDTNAKDVKHAVYVIQGNALTRAFAAFAHSEKGDRVSAMQQSRFLQECLNWVEYLCFEKDTTRVEQSLHRRDMRDGSDRDHSPLK